MLPREENEKYNAVLRAQPKQFQAKAGSLLPIKIQTKNTGSEDWPLETNLYLIQYSKASPFPEGKTFVEVGICEAESNRPEPFDIIAPSITGLHLFKFRYGIAGRGLFGDTFDI